MTHTPHTPPSASARCAPSPTGGRTVAESLSVEVALAFVRDVLAQTADADEVLVRVLAGRDTRQLRNVAGPLTEAFGGWQRTTLLGGMLGRLWCPSGGDWWWMCTDAAHRSNSSRPHLGGRVATREDADAALCAALRALGWAVLP